jgi:hypothetical protein
VKYYAFRGDQLAGKRALLTCAFPDKSSLTANLYRGTSEFPCLESSARGVSREQGKLMFCSPGKEKKPATLIQQYWLVTIGKNNSSDKSISNPCKLLAGVQPIAPPTAEPRFPATSCYS